MSLHLLKPHEATTLALQMIEHAGQTDKLLGAPTAIRANINLLLVCGGVQVRVERITRIEHPVAHVALPVLAVVCPVRGVVCCRSVVVPADLLLGDEAVGVAFADHLEDGLPVEAWSVGTGSTLEVVRESAGGRVADFAEGALDRFASVYVRV
jgi:hypothetical protein